MEEKMEIPGLMTHKTYYAATLGTDEDKEFRISVAEFLGEKKVEFRDWVAAPGAAEGDEKIPSSGGIWPLSRVSAMRRALEQIERDYGLLAGEDQ